MLIEDVREYVIRPSLKSISLWSQSSENLLTSTLAVETNGEYLMQQGTLKNGAFGFFQIQSATHADIIKWLKNRDRKYLLERVLSACFMEILPVEDDEPLVYNLRYASIIARLVYYRNNEPLPASNDAPGLVNYYLKYYNTDKGKATFAKCFSTFERLCCS